MSDFLTSLASRAMGIPQPAVQPRLASQFEPSPLAPGLDFVDAGAIETLTERDAPIPAAPPALSRRMPQLPPRPEATGPLPHEDVAPGPVAREARRAPVERFDDRHAAGDGEAPVAAPIVPQPDHPALTGAPQPALPPLAEVAGPARSARARDEPGAPAARVVHEAVDTVVERSVRVAGVEQETYRTAEAPRGVAPQPMAPPGVRGWDDAAGIEEAPVAPATINVTIGRIEVKAAPVAAPPAPRAVSRPATPSLDEYLRRRSEGRP